MASVYLVTHPSTHHDPRLMNPAALMINPMPWITNMNMNHMKKRELSFLGRGGGGRGRGRERVQTTVCTRETAMGYMQNRFQM